VKGEWGGILVNFGEFLEDRGLMTIGSPQMLLFEGNKVSGLTPQRWKKPPTPINKHQIL
jgi:hypothetical protein